MGARVVNRNALRTIIPIVAFAACGGGDGGEPAGSTSMIPFDTGTVRIFTGTDTVTLLAEIASSNDQHEVGLMERTALDPNSGMIFLYPVPQPATDAYWMWRTRIPLDIAFVDSTGRIATIHTMSPCESPNPEWCETYVAGARFQSALEANAGFFARHGIAVGDSVRLKQAGG